jgi:indole-3-glycerol phosphate synthase
MLHRIVEEKQLEVQRLKQTLTPAAVQETTLPPTRPFVQALMQSHRPISVIAEVKKASPSKGLIRADFDPVEIAAAYDRAQAEAISVLTDERFFMGSKQNLQLIRQSSTTPLLRKDFIIDPHQIYEARLLGADCILLIAAILESRQLTEFSQLAKMLNMDVLIEVHNREEVEVVLASTEPTIIGINNRNLKTFETDLRTTESLLPYVPTHVPVVSESGIHQPDDIAYLRSLGVRAVLIGEHFMRQDDIALALEELVGR